MTGGLSGDAERALMERLRICEEQQLHEGTVFFKDALDNWNQADYEGWARVDDLSPHPKSKAELEEFRRLYGLTGLDEKDIQP